MTTITDAGGNITKYAYTLSGKIKEVTDAFGKVTCVRSASGGEHYHYDILGRIIEKTDREGSVTAHTYRADGMTESILYSDGRKAEFAYSLLKQLIMVRDWLGDKKIDRDRQGQPVDITDYKGRNYTL